MAGDEAVEVREVNLEGQGFTVRITISHNSTKEEVIRNVDRSFDELFQGVGAIPVKLMIDHRSWQGSTMNFVITAKAGFMSTPIKGTVEVTDHDITVDADLGILNRFVDEKKAKEVIGHRIKGLLK